MHHISYLSLASAPLSDTQLRELLSQAHQRNAELAITGVLLYGNGRFLQVLEGEEATVRALYEKIKRDPRHQNIITYVDKPVATRSFGEWAMAFRTGEVQQVADLLGYLGPSNARINAAGLPPYERYMFEMLRAYILPQR